MKRDTKTPKAERRAARVAAGAEGLLDLLAIANVEQEVDSIRTVQGRHNDGKAEEGAQIEHQLVPLNLIHPSPWQPRTTISDEQVSALEAALSATGLLHPLPVRPHPAKAGEFELLGGHVRRAAITRLAERGDDARGTLVRATLGDVKTVLVPVTVRIGVGDDDACRVVVAENWARNDLTPVDAARAVRTLEKRERAAGREADTRTLASIVGRDHNTISRHLRVARLLEQNSVLRGAGLLADGELHLSPEALARLGRLPLKPLVDIESYKTLESRVSALRRLLTRHEQPRGASNTPESTRSPRSERPFVQLTALAGLSADRVLEVMRTQIGPAIRTLAGRLRENHGIRNDDLEAMADLLDAEVRSIRAVRLTGDGSALS